MSAFTGSNGTRGRLSELVIVRSWPEFQHQLRAREQLMAADASMCVCLLCTIYRSTGSAMLLVLATCKGVTPHWGLVIKKGVKAR